jgi:molybdopterin molybdotransferase
MAQLSDDCFAFGGALMRIEDAASLIAARLPVLAGTERVSLAEADGRVAAEDVLAGHDVPPFANSAVDGYAVRYADLDGGGETRLPVLGRLAAGAAPDAVETPGGAVRIFTGAPCRPAPTRCSCRRTCAARARPSSCRRA